MTDDSERGRFTWHELMTPNPGGAREFYSAVVGWTAEPDEENSSRVTFIGPAGPLGGCSERSPTAAPKWIPFVTVGNVDDTLRAATERGAGVVVQPTDVDQGGRYAVLTDPQGAAIGIYSGEDIGPDRDSDPGEFSWHELATSDSSAAFEFYSALFGWESVAEHDMGEMGVYRLFGRAGKQLGGMFDKPPGAGEPAWLSYVRVSDLDGTVEKVRAARGSVKTEPTEVPGGDWIAQLLDPHGAAFAVHVLAADVKSKGADKRAGSEASSVGSAQREGDEQRAAERASAEGRKAESRKASSSRKGSRSAAPKASSRDATAAATDDSTVTEIWSGATAGTEASGTKKAARKKPSKAKAAKKAKASAGKAAKSAKKKSAAKKPAAKKAADKKAAKKASKKKAGKKKAAARPAAKKAAKKKPAKKKPAKKTAKKAAKKTAKKAGKAGKKSPRKAGSAGGKKSRSAGRSKAGKKKAAKRTGKKKARR